MTAYEDFLADPAALRDWGDWVIDLYPKDPSGAVVNIPISFRGFSIGTTDVVITPDTLSANTIYQKRVLEGPSTEESIWNRGTIGGTSIPSFGGLRINNSDGGLDQYIDYAWEGERCVIRYGGYTPNTGHVMTIDEFGVKFDGVMGLASFDAVITIPLRGRESEFSVPLNQRTYRGTSYQLELDSETIAYGTPAALDITGNMTIEQWMYLPTAASGGTGIWGWTGAGDIPWKLTITSTSAVRFVCTISTASETVTTTKTLDFDTFYHVAVAVDGRDVIFYIWDDDARELTTETFIDGLSSSNRDAVGASTYNHFAGASVTYWVDEARVWNTDRSASEITNNRFKELTTVPSSCVHYLKFNEGTGTTVEDFSATGSDGTIGAGTHTWLYSLEGTADLHGKVKPDVWGQVYNITPVQIQSTDYIYQVAGDGKIDGFTSVQEGGNRTGTGIAFGSELATLKEILDPGTVPAVGEYDTFEPRGVFRLGSKLTYPVTADVTGYDNGGAGYVSTAASIIRDIVGRRGPELADPGNLDTTSFTDIDTATGSAVCGVYYSSEVNIDVIIDYLVKSFGGYWGFEAGLTDFRLGQWTGAAVSADHDLTSSEIVSIEPLDQRTQVGKVIVRYRRNYTKMSDSDMTGDTKGAANEADGSNLYTVLQDDWLQTLGVDYSIYDDNKQARTVIIDTPLQEKVDADAEAARVLALIKDGDRAWKIVVEPSAGNIKIDETVTLDNTLQTGVTYLGLDGTKEFSVVTVNNDANRTITLEVV